MSTRDLEMEEPSFEEFLEAARRQVPITSEPKNGGTTVAGFFAALQAINDDYEPDMVVSLKPYKKS